MKHLRLFWELIRINIKKSLIYRVNFAVTFVSISLWILLYVIFFEVIFSHVDTLGGWNKGEALVVLGFYYIVQGISNIFYRENFENFDQRLRQGELDQVLTKPASPQMLSFFMNMRIDHIVDLLITSIIFLYVHTQTDVVLTWPLLGLGLLISLFGNILFYSILLSLVTLVFFFDRIEVIGSTLWNISQIARYPRQIYTKFAGVLAQFIFPVALLASIPAEVALGEGSLKWVATFGGLSILYFIFGNICFSLGIRRYNSAN
jgi:ABC-2 type transport system permease protein